MSEQDLLAIAQKLELGLQVALNLSCLRTYLGFLYVGLQVTC